MKIEHVAIWVNDLDQVKDFYSEYFNVTAGAMYENTSKGFKSYFLSFDSGARLEIMSRLDIKERDNTNHQYMGYCHLAISLNTKEEVISLTERMKENGIEVIDGPRTTGDGYFESVVLDPEGNRVEITC